MNTKEYLNPKNWSLHLVNVDNDAAGKDWIEVPEGADKFLKISANYNQFYKDSFKKVWNGKVWTSTVWVAENIKIWRSLDVLWQRHTQPESLPFVDDEVQSINDQYAEIEKVRQARNYGTVKKAQASDGVDATLEERQSQYGCYEDVAFVTENIIGVLKKCNYDLMPHAHRMAMYMIASKIARLVNGDCNHKDSWHDIQGYAKLVEDLL